MTAPLTASAAPRLAPTASAGPRPALTLARPQWRIGQILLPEHFLCLEAALAAEAALRTEILGPPAYGIARLVWNGDRPENGVLWVSELCAVMRDGTLVDVPGNARTVGPLNLKETGRREVEVYAYVVKDGHAPGEPAMDPASPEDIPRAFHTVKLTTDRGVTNIQGRIELGRFVLDAEGAFRLSDGFVPPLLCLRGGATPYLARRLLRLRGEIGELEGALDETSLEALARGESLSAIQRVRIESRKVSAMLEDMERGVGLHPYQVYSALRAFSLDLGLLDEAASPWHPPSYDHDDLSGCLSLVLAEISARIRVPPPESPCVPFVLDNGRLIAGELPPEALSAAELYVAILKARAGDQVSMDGVTMASPSRLRLVREHTLRGVRLHPVPRAPFRHGFGPAVDFYRIAAGAGGEEPREWASVVKDRAIAFQAPAALEGLRAILCWRRI